MSLPLILECAVHFQRRGRGGPRDIKLGPEPIRPAPPPGRVPRVSRFMALALRFEAHLRTGHVRTYSALARLGRVSRPRISQILNLLNLAPDIQEAILLLPRIERGRDAIILRALQPIASTLNWHKQRRLWAELRARVEAASPRAERPLAAANGQESSLANLSHRNAGQTARNLDALA
jgi:hypothetical protein